MKLPWISRRRVAKLAWWETSRANSLGPKPKKVTRREYAMYLRGRSEALREILGLEVPK